MHEHFISLLMILTIPHINVISCWYQEILLIESHFWLWHVCKPRTCNKGKLLFDKTNTCQHRTMCEGRPWNPDTRLSPPFHSQMTLWSGYFITKMGKGTQCQQDIYQECFSSARAVQWVDGLCWLRLESLSRPVSKCVSLFWMKQSDTFGLILNSRIAWGKIWVAACNF